MTVNHVIGWDPTTKSVKTWGFGGNGGHGEMAWTEKGLTNWTEESKDWTAPDGQNCHFILETKLSEDKLQISGFFATAGQEKTEIVISATKGKH